jgi:hypothetical protein
MYTNSNIKPLFGFQVSRGTSWPFSTVWHLRQQKMEINQKTLKMEFLGRKSIFYLFSEMGEIP